MSPVGGERLSSVVPACCATCVESGALADKHGRLHLQCLLAGRRSQA